MQTAFNRFENTQKPQTASVNAHVSIEQSLSPSLIPTVTRVMAKTSVDPLQEQFKAQTALQDNVNTVEKKPVLNPPELRKHQYEENPGAIFQTEPTVERYIPKKKEVSEIEPLLTDMAIIEGGEYYRGSDVGARDEKPRHRVILSSFAQQLLKGRSLTAKQLAIAHKKLPKYGKQVMSLIPAEKLEQLKAKVEA
jgi:ABC-type lipoprotein release transport system permease subunit